MDDNNYDYNKIMEDLFWKVFRNIYLKNKIISFLKTNDSINYKNLNDVDGILYRFNSIALLKEKVKRGEKLLFRSLFRSCYQNNDNDDSFRPIFIKIKDDKEFYINLFTNYQRYIVSYDIKAKWAIKTKNILAYKILIENFNHQPTKESLLIAINSNSIEIINYLIINHYSSVVGVYTTLGTISMSSSSSSSSSSEILIPNELNNEILKFHFGMKSHLKLSKFYENCSSIRLRMDEEVKKDLNFNNLVYWFQDCFNNNKFKHLIRDCKLLNYLYSINIVQPKLNQFTDKITLEFINEINNKYSPKTKISEILNEKDIKKLIQYYHSLNGFSLLYFLNYDQDNDCNIVSHNEINTNDTDFNTLDIKLAFEYGSINYIKFRFDKYNKEKPDENYDTKRIDIQNNHIFPNIYNKNEIFENQKNQEKRIKFINDFIDCENESINKLLPINMFIELLVSLDDLELVKLAHLKAKTKSTFKILLEPFTNIKSTNMFKYCIDNKLYETIGNDQIKKWYKKGRTDLMKCYETILIKDKGFTKEQIKNRDNNLLPFFSRKILKSPKNNDLCSLSHILKNSDIYSFDEINFDCIINVKNMNLNDLITIVENANFNYGLSFIHSLNPIDLIPNLSHYVKYERWYKFIYQVYDKRINIKEFYEYTNLYENNEIDELILTINKNQTTIKNLHHLLSKISECGDIKTLKSLMEKTSLFNLENLQVNSEEILIILVCACQTNNINIFQFFIDNFKNVFLLKKYPKEQSIDLQSNLIVTQSNFNLILYQLTLSDNIDFIDFLYENFGYNLNITFYFKESLFYKYFGSKILKNN